MIHTILLIIQIIFSVFTIIYIYKFIPVKRINTMWAGDKYYTVVCENTTDELSEAIVFGGHIYGGNAQLNKGINVTICESSHAQVRLESIHKPIKIKGFRYLTSSAKQLNSQILKIERHLSTGHLDSRPFRPVSYKTQWQYHQDQIDVPEFKLTVDGCTYIRVPLLPNETATLLFKIKSVSLSYKIKKYLSDGIYRVFAIFKNKKANKVVVTNS